ncbi:hypothetical protein A3770_07p48520 [Chloropicon primus]|uniref:Uncharacterized protein n=1 Tax=Chloropicon primus TaxID=1764295 RepID=A0A5B8MQP2_9CHLO|nr:hypothetical protein A3770_07p48520 [Chloropicon primus]|eukprot:QDZ22334.1 hypothetical protein A3770_07p48520 [Chloropicon primus]
MVTIITTLLVLLVLAPSAMASENSYASTSATGGGVAGKGGKLEIGSRATSGASDMGNLVQSGSQADSMVIVRGEDGVSPVPDIHTPVSQSSSTAYSSNGPKPYGNAAVESSAHTVGKGGAASGASASTRVQRRDNKHSPKTKSKAPVQLGLAIASGAASAGSQGHSESSTRVDATSNTHARDRDSASYGVASGSQHGQARGSLGTSIISNILIQVEAQANQDHETKAIADLQSHTDVYGDQEAVTGTTSAAMAGASTFDSGLVGNDLNLAGGDSEAEASTSAFVDSFGLELHGGSAASGGDVQAYAGVDTATTEDLYHVGHDLGGAAGADALAYAGGHAFGRTKGFTDTESVSNLYGETKAVTDTFAVGTGVSNVQGVSRNVIEGSSVSLGPGVNSNVVYGDASATSYGAASFGPGHVTGGAQIGGDANLFTVATGYDTDTSADIDGYGDVEATTVSPKVGSGSSSQAGAYGAADVDSRAGGYNAYDDEHSRAATLMSSGAYNAVVASESSVAEGPEAVSYGAGSGRAKTAATGPLTATSDQATGFASTNALGNDLGGIAPAGGQASTLTEGEVLTMTQAASNAQDMGHATYLESGGVATADSMSMSKTNPLTAGAGYLDMGLSSGSGAVGGSMSMSTGQGNAASHGGFSTIDALIMSDTSSETIVGSASAMEDAYLKDKFGLDIVPSAAGAGVASASGMGGVDLDGQAVQYTAHDGSLEAYGEFLGESDAESYAEISNIATAAVDEAGNYARAGSMGQAEGRGSGNAVANTISDDSNIGFSAGGGGDSQASTGAAIFAPQPGYDPVHDATTGISVAETDGSGGGLAIGQTAGGVSLVSGSAGGVGESKASAETVARPGDRMATSVSAAEGTGDGGALTQTSGDQTTAGAQAYNSGTAKGGSNQVALIDDGGLLAGDQTGWTYDAMSGSMTAATAVGDNAVAYLEGMAIAVGDTVPGAPTPFGFADAYTGGHADGEQFLGQTGSMSAVEVDIQVPGVGNDVIQTDFHDGKITGGFSATKGLAFGNGQGLASSSADENEGATKAAARTNALGFGAGVGASIGLRKDGLDAAFGAGSGLSFALADGSAKLPGSEPSLLTVGRSGGASRGFALNDGRYEGIGHGATSGDGLVHAAEGESTAESSSLATGWGGAIVESGDYAADVLAIGHGFGIAGGQALIEDAGVGSSVHYESGSSVDVGPVPYRNNQPIPDGRRLLAGLV